MNDVERDWQEFWVPLVAPDGVPDIEAIKRELYDFHQIMQEVSIAYDEVTGGRLSKPNTAAHHVINAVNERIDRLIDDAIQDMTP